MIKIIPLILFIFLFQIVSYETFGQTRTDQPSPLFGEVDGTNAGRYRSVKFSNGTTTNNGDGSITVTTGGGGGSSPWTETGTNIYPVMLTNNVGVGTTAPDAELSITSTAANDLFRVNDLGVGDPTPFVINSIGNVGIGTSSPSRSLSVYASTPVVQITNPTAGGTANDGLLFTQSFLDSIIENSEAGSLYLRTTATNRVRIDAGGNVGIGTISVDAKLNVLNTVAIDSFRVDDQASDTTPFIIDSNGRVGIGTVEPQEDLQIYATSGTAAFQIETLDTTARAEFSLLEAGVVQGLFQWRGTTNPIFPNTLRLGTNTSSQFWLLTGGAARMAILSGGNIGIGTTLPTGRLHVASSDADDLFKVDDTAGDDVSPFVIKSDGNVGVGLVTPTALVHVQQTAALDSFRVDDQASDTTPFLINSVGNVGIGTTVLDSLIATPGVLKIGIPAATSAPLRVLGGSGGSDIITLERTSGATATYGWSLAGGGLTFSDRIVNSPIMGLYGDSSANELYYGVRGSTGAHTRPSVLHGGSFNGTFVGANVPGNDLLIKGGMGVGTANSGNIIFITGNVGVGTLSNQTDLTRMTIVGSSGNVGIGSVSPSSILDIDIGTGVGQITINGSTGGCLMIRDTDDAGWTECDVLDGVMTCSIDADGICD